MPFALAALTAQLLEASSLTLSDIQRTLAGALSDALGPDQWGYVQDVIGTDTEGELIYTTGGKLWKCAYTIAGKDRKVTLQTSKAKQVLPQMSYVVSGGVAIEAAKFLAEASGELLDLDALKESSGGLTRTIKVIAAGQGSSAFYPKKVLQEQGPRVFKKDTKMYWNHPTRNEEASRPEGDLSNLAGVLTDNAYWDENGKSGPGLYAPVKVFSDFAEQVASKGPHIGVSIRAYGTGETKEGVYTLKNFSHAESVDFVTEPGAGGRVLEESSKKPTDLPIEEKQEPMTDLEFAAKFAENAKPLQATIGTLTESNKTLTEANARLATEAAALRVRAATSDARAYLAEKAKTEKLPGASKLRAVEAVLAQTLPLTEAGALDKTKLDALYVEAVKAEADFITSITQGGAVVNLGESASDVAISDEDVRKRSIEAGKRMGLSDSDAAILAESRG